MFGFLKRTKEENDPVIEEEIDDEVEEEFTELDFAKIPQLLAEAAAKADERANEQAETDSSSQVDSTQIKDFEMEPWMTDTNEPIPANQESEANQLIKSPTQASDSIDEPKITESVRSSAELPMQTRLAIQMQSQMGELTQQNQILVEQTRKWSGAYNDLFNHLAEWQQYATDSRAYQKKLMAQHADEIRILRIKHDQELRDSQSQWFEEIANIKTEALRRYEQLEKSTTLVIDDLSQHMLKDRSELSTIKKHTNEVEDENVQLRAELERLAARIKTQNEQLQLLGSVSPEDVLAAHGLQIQPTTIKPAPIPAVEADEWTLPTSTPKTKR